MPRINHFQKKVHQQKLFLKFSCLYFLLVFSDSFLTTPLRLVKNQLVLFLGVQLFSFS